MSRCVSCNAGMQALQNNLFPSKLAIMGLGVLDITTDNLLLLGLTAKDMLEHGFASAAEMFNNKVLKDVEQASALSQSIRAFGVMLMGIDNTYDALMHS